MDHIIPSPQNKTRGTGALHRDIYQELRFLELNFRPDPTTIKHSLALLRELDEKWNERAAIEKALP